MKSPSHWIEGIGFATKRCPKDMSNSPEERLEALLSHHIENELVGSEKAEVEAYLAKHPEAEANLAFERALQARLRTLPKETVPTNFAENVMKKAPTLPGGMLHQIEMTLRKLLAPGLVAAAGMAGVLAFVAPQTGVLRAPRSYQPPPLQVATVMTHSGSVKLGSQTLEPGLPQTVFRGQPLVLAKGSSALLSIGEGVEVTVAEETELVLEPRMIRLDLGKVHVKVRPGIGHFIVRGPQASAEVIGTEFAVETTGLKTTVQVDHGIVETKAIRGGASVQLIAGGSATVDSSAPSKLQIQGPVRNRPRPLTVLHEGPGKRLPSSEAEQLPLLDSY